jgi:RimJ/RimL family protein N-acetyltransferase
MQSADDMRRYVETALAEQEAGTALAFATVERASNTVVGSTRFANAVHEHRRVEIGWTWISPRWQRTGVNTEAKYLMLRHAFDVLGCRRVELKTNALNTRSRGQCSGSVRRKKAHFAATWCSPTDRGVTRCTSP